MDSPRQKKKQGRLKATWRRTVEKEIKAMGLTWGEVEMAAWIELVGGLMLLSELRARTRSLMLLSELRARRRRMPS